MTLQLGDTAPDFTADTTAGTLHFHEWLGDSWGVFFSHPADFTPVCTTEVGRVSLLKAAFAERNTKILALSMNTLSAHRDWIKDIEAMQEVVVNFPIVADADGRIASMYAMVHPQSDAGRLTARSVFVIAPDKSIKLLLTYPASTGRNFQEILRVLDSLQLTTYHHVATPVDWQQGEDCVIDPNMTDSAQMHEKFPKGWRELRPYLRLTPQPNK